MRKRWKKFLLCTMFAALLVPVLAVPAMATGDVAGAIQSTWTTAQTQIRAVVDNVVVPVIDMVVAVLVFVRVGGAFWGDRKLGLWAFTAPAILFACLIFTLTAPLYIWTIL